MQWRSPFPTTKARRCAVAGAVPQTDQKKRNNPVRRLSALMRREMGLDRVELAPPTPRQDLGQTARGAPGLLSSTGRQLNAVTESSA
jgi:hypothetical protein